MVYSAFDADQKEKAGEAPKPSITTTGQPGSQHTKACLESCSII